jgi:hypothetical protein
MYLFVDIFINISINTTAYAINMADFAVIKCSKCYIYKPHLNFVKDGPLKKLLKLYQSCRLKAHFPYILLLLLFTFLGLQIYYLNKWKALIELGPPTKTHPKKRQFNSAIEIEPENTYLPRSQNSQDTPEVA